jgi:hypothetical protein
MGQMEMKCILYFLYGAKVTQVSDVAHGPLVYLCIYSFYLRHTQFVRNNINNEQ